MEVINVVNSLDSLAREVVFTLGIGWICHNTHSLSGLSSAQIWTAYESLGTTTIVAPQVQAYGQMILPPDFTYPIVWIEPRSQWEGILCGALRENGWQLGLGLIVYCDANISSPVSMAGYCEDIIISNSLVTDNPRIVLGR